MNSPGRTSADSRPSWLATRRYGFRPAPPGGLALVQDFLNTREHAEHGPDLLGDAEHANAWAANAIRNWSVLRGTRRPFLALTDDDAARLRDLRDFLDVVLTGSRIMPPQQVLGTAGIALGVAGEVSWMPTGHGWCWLAAAIMGEIALSQETGTWRRMKQCRKPPVPGHLLRQLMGQPRRLPPTFVDVDDVGEGWRPTPTTDKPEQAKVAK